MELNGKGVDAAFGDRRGNLKAEYRALQGADCGMKEAGPEAAPGGETIANGHEGNSTGHGSAGHMPKGLLCCSVSHFKGTY